MYQIILRLLAQITILRRRLILKRCKDYLGRDFTPLDVVPDEFGCAEAVTTLLMSCGCFDRVIAGTWTLNDALQRSKYWMPVSEPEVGDIIISPTGMRRRSTSIKNGHVGIVGENNIIYSNDSYTGKWLTHYTIDSWTTRYSKIGTYPIFYYRYISVL